jgi:hydrogenase maturation protease
MRRILIAGIGNILLEDDGVGPFVARSLAAAYEFEDGVEVADLGTPALDLIDEISDRDAVILIDSVKSEGAPGTIMLYRKAEIIKITPTVRMDPHSPALVETLLAADLFGQAPEDLLLVGVTGKSYNASCRLSDPVRGALDNAVAEVLRELDRLGVHYERKRDRGDAAIWWAPAERSRQAPPLR